MDWLTRESKIRADFKECFGTEAGKRVLDKLVKDHFKIPVFGYQVSGEYTMIAQSVKKNILEKDAILESLMAIKRAGASAIVTYFAIEVAKRLKNKL